MLNILFTHHALSFSGSFRSEQRIAFQNIREVYNSGTYSITTWRYTVRVLAGESARVSPYLYLFLNPETMNNRPASNGAQEAFAWLCLRRRQVPPLYPTGRHPLFIQLSLENSATCSLDIDTLDIICEGKIEWAAPVATRWIARIAYECDSPEQLPFDLDYNITVERHANATCRPTSEALSEFVPNRVINLAVQTCSSFYPSYSLYNSLGWEQSDIYFMMNYYPTATLVSCHKHILESMCRLAFPQCTVDNQPIYFCLEMCNDFMVACEGVEAIRTWIPTCGSNRRLRGEGGLCIYKDVYCNEDPLEPMHGYVNITTRMAESTATFHCNDGYTLAENTTSLCSWSGNWDTLITPECVKVSGSRVIEENHQERLIIIASCISGSILVIIVAGIIFGLTCKYNIIIFSYRYCRLALCCKQFISSFKDKNFHAYIAYDDEHDDDRTFSVNLHQDLETYGFKVMMEALQLPNEAPGRYIPNTIC